MINKSLDKLSEADEVSIEDIVLKISSIKQYLKLKWKIIFIAGIIGGFLGLAYSYFKKPVYTAITTFVLDDGGKGGGLSQYSGLASLAGINLDNNGGDIFQGDNIIDLYTSRTMIEKALLTKYKFDNKEELIIDNYLDFKKIRNDWTEKPELHNINFNGDPANFNRNQDSIIIAIIAKLNKENLSVTKPNKKTSIIQVEFSENNELFAKAFTQTLVSTVNSFYIQTKTKKAVENLGVLQRQADSVRRVLNISLSGVAASIDAAPNANPYQLSLKVPSQKKSVDVQSNAAIYQEVVKNMEVAKIALMQAKPLIQVIDEPLLPLKKDKIGKIKGTFLGIFLGVFLTAVALLLSRFLNQYKAN